MDLYCIAFTFSISITISLLIELLFAIFNHRLKGLLVFSK